MKRIEINLTPEQEKILNAKVKAAGFYRRSEYIRFILFMERSFIEKINEIHKEVVK